MVHEQEVYRVPELARRLGLTERGVRSLIARGDLSSRRIGRGKGRLVVLRRDLDQYLDNLKTA